MNIMPAKPTTQWCYLIGLGIVTLLGGCKSNVEETAGTPSAIPVFAITVNTEPLTQTSEYPGRIESIRVAEVRARVPGIILSRHFTEGAEVQAGDILFQIDPRHYQAVLARTKADLAKAEALLLEAQSIAKRYESLVEISAVSKQEFESKMTAIKSAEAIRDMAKAELQTAELNLEYATVTAPISGRIGRALVTEGALVGQNEATQLAVIQQIDPVYVRFKQPASEALKLRKVLAKEQHNGSTNLWITVDGVEEKIPGQLLFSDISVDQSTGQLSLHGQINNSDNTLLPGMYVRVHIDAETDHNAILIPQRAVRPTSGNSATVQVIDSDNKVIERVVKTGKMHGSRWHITEGLNHGERVIVGGTGTAELSQGTSVEGTIREDTEPQKR